VPRPVSWVVRLTGRSTHTIRCDGELWSRERGEGPADLVVELSPEAWARFLTESLEERSHLLDESLDANGRERRPPRRLNVTAGRNRHW
jgi:hypothetical protein